MILKLQNFTIFQEQKYFITVSKSPNIPKNVSLTFETTNLFSKFREELIKNNIC